MEHGPNDNMSIITQLLVWISLTPEETITSDIERALFSSPKDSEDHRHSVAKGETDRETEGDAAVNRRRQIKFLGCTHRPRWMVLACADQESSDWLKAMVETL
ncbi:hypothetical protein JTB14_035558 [Gonioctena quinquepunctata]|nr:hypothetical protein JTB14_035558 [Gonioctena quinquepunctata]